MQKKIAIVIFLLFPFLISHAGTIQGTVSDASTGELLVGCTVYIESLNKGTITGLDGTYLLKNIPSGSYNLHCSFISYKPIDHQISIRKDELSTSDFQLEYQNTDLNEIFVLVHRELGTEKSARSSEKNATNIINVMSAKAIELSPDLNVANVIQRMSGVTTERSSSGQAQYAILRGMDKRYNYTLVNGVKIPSPNNKHRYIPLNLFPSELLDRVEVTKSLTADMEGDATGGVINMLMKDAPAQFYLQANAALGYNSRFINNDLVLFPMNSIQMQSPRELYGKDYKATMDDFNLQSGKLNETTPLPNGTAGIAVGNRFAHNRFGFIVAGNYQNFNKGYSSSFFDEEMIQTERTVRLTEKKEREYSENIIQYGIHTKADFKQSAKHNFEWYNAFIHSRTSQVRQSTSLSYKLNYSPENGNEDLSLSTRLRSQFQNIFASTLQGKHELSPALHLNWSAVYSFATNREPENTSINIDNLRQDFVDNIYVDADGSTRRWEHNSDRDLAAYINMVYYPDLGTSNLRLKAGGLFRDKQRQNSYVNYRFKPLNGDQRYGIDYETLDEIRWAVYTQSGSVGPLEYDANEDIGAAYIDANWAKDKLIASAGIRAEYTNQGYYMYFPNAGTDPNGGQQYVDILPSAQVKYKLKDNTNLKASYFRSINRPGFFEIVPYQIVNEEYNEFGNSDLKRATIDNIDLRWEYFPKQKEQLMVGLFYKSIKNPIEYAYFTVNYRQYGYGPVNLGDAQNFGAEIDFIKFIRNFGIRANYTFTHSVIVTPKAYYGQDENGNYKRMFEDQARPLVGQAAHVANLSLMYKDTRHGFDAQLSAAYTGEKIVIASHYLDSDYWQSPSFQLDASAEKHLKNGFTLFAKLNNIANSPDREYIKTHNDYNNKFDPPAVGKNYTLIRGNVFGRTILLGIRYKL